MGNAEMTESKWTPGPWTVDILTSSDPNGDEWETDIEICSDEGKFIHGHDLGYDDDVDDQIKANARLIAAAPEMYEALAVALEALGDAQDFADFGGIKPIYTTKIAVIRAALAKARGEK